jgi:ABC-type Fe3+ transport system permease subunit
VSTFTLRIALAAALLAPVLTLLGAVLAVRLVWRHWYRPDH